MGFDPISAICDTVGTIVNKIWPDATEENKAKVALAMQESTQQFQLVVEQIKVSAIEAASADPYTSRWRPTVGYICCAALAGNFIIHPLFMWIVAIAKLNVVTPPTIEGGLLELVFGMLGIGGMRTWEKIKGVSK